MAEIRNEAIENSDEYQRGWRDGNDAMKSDLVKSLQLKQRGDDTGAELISARMAREIFTDVYGVVEADKVFGDDPDDLFSFGLTGRYKKSALAVR